MPYTEESSLPEVTDEMLNEALGKVRPYAVVLLKAGPRFTGPAPDRDESVSKVIWQHGKRNFALRAARLMPIVCPIADGSGLTGVGIFDATPEETDRIMAQDPGVAAGIFTYEIHPTRSFPGSSLP